MDTLAGYLIAEHIREIHSEADANRLARLASSERTRASWRRRVGGAARRLSVRLDVLATQFDPAPRRASYGRE